MSGLLQTLPRSHFPFPEKPTQHRFIILSFLFPICENLFRLSTSPLPDFEPQMTQIYTDKKSPRQVQKLRLPFPICVHL
jgi:hypothetical protein